MKHRQQQSAPRRAVVLACAGMAIACAAKLPDSPSDAPGGAGAAGTGPGGSSGAAGSGTSTTPCSGPVVVNAKRIVRLSFNQISNSVRALLGNAAGDLVDTRYEIGNAEARTFPPLASPREGSVITDSTWGAGDGIAQTAGQYVFDNFATLTGCGAAPTDACGQQFLNQFAERAFRRPLAAEEQSRLLGVYNSVKTTLGTVNDAVQYGVYAVLQAPQFLYRTEFGAGSAQDGTLSPYEVASELSYFLTDGPPDQTLLDAARQNQLGTPELVALQATRILGTPAARTNLESAMFAYFGLPSLQTVVIDPMRFPEFTGGLRDSMFRESELFFANTLWNGALTNLLTSRRSTINASLARIYNVAFPPPGAVLDADGFATVDLPQERSGLLTQPGFLTSRSRPDVGSVVARGLVVNAAVLCATNPPFPEDPALLARISEAKTTLENATEREKAAFRAATVPCTNCHSNFDPFGLALDNFDSIGRFRQSDEQGRPIDASVTLPASAGGTMAQNAVDMEQKLADGPAFAACVAKNMLNFALAEGSNLTPNSCSTQAITQSFNSSDRSFSALLRAIASSQSFTSRSAGAQQ